MRKTSIILLSVFVAFLSMNFFVTPIAATDSVIKEMSAINSNSFPQYAINIFNEYVEIFPDKSEVIEGTINQLLSNDDYIAGYEFDSQSAIKTMRGTLETALSSFDEASFFDSNNRGTNYNGLFYSDYTVPVVKQMTNYYCGPAALIQSLIGNGLWPNIPSKKTLAMQQSTAPHFLPGFSSDYVESYLQSYGARPFMMANALNYYYSGVESFVAENVTIYTTEYPTIVKMSRMLTDGYCPLVSIPNLSELNYYAEYTITTGHWVTVSCIDDIHDTITLVDPHYNPTYGGTHTVSYEEFFSALGTTNGWVMYVE